MSGGEELQRGADGHVNPESRGGHVKLYGPASEEMMKPLLFGNHQRLFKIFTALVTAATTYYMVFHQDFGPNRHVFSWIRELKERKKREFFQVDPDDTELQKLKEKMQQHRTSPEHTQTTVTNNTR